MSDIPETSARDVETRYRNGSTAVAAVDAEEEFDNPFQADGELRRKADYIITHSRISRIEIQIADPDSPGSVPSSSAEEQLDGQPHDTSKHNAAESQAVSTIASPSHSERPVEAEVAEVAAAVTDQQAPSRAEKVKVKKKRCVVQ